MHLLAQINFDREKVEAPLPQGGMLQFFLAYDDVYGLHYHDEIRQKNWRVVYHEKIDTNMNAELVEGLGIPTDTENQEYYSPVLKSCVFSLGQKRDVDYFYAFGCLRYVDLGIGGGIVRRNRSGLWQ